MRDYPHVFEYPYSVVDDVPFDMKGHWGERFFKNDRPIVLELGCGRGEYTVGLGRLFPEKNFIGVDMRAHVDGSHRVASGRHDQRRLPAYPD